jgi:hypothetical protein
MGRLGYGAANVGERDLKAGYDRLMARAGKAAFPLLSANILREDTGQPVFTPQTVVEALSPDGEHSLRIGLIGVARYNPLFRKPGPDGVNLVIEHPLEAIRRGLASLAEQNVDRVVLLAAMHREDARRILQEISGIDFIVGSYGGMASTQLDEGSGTWVLYSGNQGKRLGESRFCLDDGPEPRVPVHKLHYLTSLYPADPEMLAFVNEVRPTAARAAAKASGAGKPVAAGLVGSARCRQCHADVYSQWSATAHADAFDSLDGEKEQADPRCLRCHTTGAGQPGGFRGYLATPGMAQVGCESCHGPGRAHSETAGRGYGKVGLETCTTCHDAENSPDFDYYSYREKVTHRSRGSR